jgi:hypothetical protein
MTAGGRPGGVGVIDPGCLAGLAPPGRDHSSSSRIPLRPPAWVHPTQSTTGASASAIAYLAHASRIAEARNTEVDTSFGPARCAMRREKRVHQVWDQRADSPVVGHFPPRGDGVLPSSQPGHGPGQRQTAHQPRGRTGGSPTSSNGCPTDPRAGSRADTRRPTTPRHRPNSRYEGRRWPPLLAARTTRRRGRWRHVTGCGVFGPLARRRSAPRLVRTSEVGREGVGVAAPDGEPRPWLHLSAPQRQSGRVFARRRPCPCPFRFLRGCTHHSNKGEGAGTDRRCHRGPGEHREVYAPQRHAG